MPELFARLRDVPLRTVVLVFLLVYGMLPLLVALGTGLRRERELVRTQQQINLTHRVEALSSGIAWDVETTRGRLDQLATTLAGVAQTGLGGARREAWTEAELDRVAIAGRLLFPRGRWTGREATWQAGDVPPAVEARSEEVLAAIESGAKPPQSFLELGDGTPAVLLSAVGEDPEGAPRVALTAVVPLDLRPEQAAVTSLLAADGGLLWSESLDESYRAALERSQLAEDFAKRPSVLVREIELASGERPLRAIAQVGPIRGLGWGLVVQHAEAVAFSALRDTVDSWLVSALLLLVLALVFAVGASQMVTRPIRNLARSSAEIAEGSYGARVGETGFSREVTDLAKSFNRMSAHIGESVDRLRRAAVENHELFLGSIRAMLAAIEAKEPYTRGHSERVAAFSQAIAREAGFDAEFQEQIWVAGLLHDVGKLGIDDRVLKKGNALTAEEYREIQRHPVVGAEIIEPIEQLAYSLPAIRWHHEKWNGKGYPDGLAGEAIPPMARIVAVADSFDAMTTQRVYQDAMSAQEAVAWISEQSDVLFESSVVRAFRRAIERGEIEPADPGESAEPVPLRAARGGERLYT